MVVSRSPPADCEDVWRRYFPPGRRQTNQTQEQMSDDSDNLHDLSDADFAATMKTLHPVYPQLIDANGEFIHRGVILDEEQRFARDDENVAEQLRDGSRAFAKSLIDSMSAAERVACAAPARYVNRPMRRGEFSVREPKYIEERHGPFIDCRRSFGERAQTLGFSSNYGATVRAELVLLHLLRGEVPPWTAVLDARVKNTPEDEGPILTALWPLLIETHSADLALAEADQITRAPFSPLRTSKAKLAADLWSALSDAKLASNHMSLRSLFKVLKRVVTMCRSEIAL